MGKGRRYDQEYKNMIVDLFKSGMSLEELSSEYGIANYYERTLKDVQHFKRINNQFFKSLNEVTEIFIVGHYFGEVDKIYFQEIKKNVNDDIK